MQLLYIIICGKAQALASTFSYVSFVMRSTTYYVYLLVVNELPLIKHGPTNTLFILHL